MAAAESGSLGRKTSKFFAETVDADVALFLANRSQPEKQDDGHVPELLRILREQKEQRNKEGSQAVVPEKSSEEEEEGSASELFHEETSTTENHLTKKEISEEDRVLMEQRIAQQQRQFERHRRREEQRKVRRMLEVADYLNEEEAQRALADCKGDEEEVILRFADGSRDYLAEIRREIAIEGGREVLANADAAGVYHVAHAADGKKRLRSSARRQTQEDRERLKTYVYKRLSLNDALRALKSCDNIEEAMKDWSPARKQAYKLIDENPNAYYYRFNAPGEEQRNGAWTKEEQELFMSRLAECGADGQWGIFSMKIPGRVGYQCSNYYRSLIEKKKIVDPNYFLDEKGKCRYLFKKKGETEQSVRRFKRKNKDGSDDEESPRKEKKPRARKSSPKPKKKGKGKRRGSDDDSDSDVDDDNMTADKFNYKPDRSFYTTKRLRLKHGELNEEDMAEAPNPLPGVVDPITLMEVVMPAVSPTGHVMSYSSWLQCLENSDKCPLTKQPLKKEQLVILTPENIDMYRDTLVIST
eukprot:comp17201_c0_seq1/m.16131 comp17201_c0_seq1/g.16131  ORF comp17201_c0_seq1/g.16131 comp17201_c0_seq1/m.16131 type:complete len:528 (-) comp17201_c0_seq1:483-2066(-)